MLLMSDFSLHALVLPGWHWMMPSFVGGVFSFLVILWFINLYNFMDGIDGLAGGTGMIGFACLGLLGAQSDAWGFAAVCAAISAACAGFLLSNFAPARIFMGDVGSAFLGFTFAALSVLAAQQNPRLAVAGILLLWPFIFDTIGTFLRRLRRRENVFAAHRSHLYQRLVIAGYSHRTVTLLYSGLALVGLVLALVWVLALPGADWLALGLPGLLGFGLWQFVVRAETASLALQRATPPVGDSP